MKTNFNLSINEELLDVAKQYCESLDQNLNDLIARFLREFLKSAGHYVGPKPGDITPRTAQPTEEDALDEDERMDFERFAEVYC